MDTAALASLSDSSSTPEVLGAFAVVVAAVVAAVGVHSAVVAFTLAAIVSSVLVNGGGEDNESRTARPYGELLQRTDPGARQNLEVAAAWRGLLVRQGYTN